MKLPDGWTHARYLAYLETPRWADVRRRARQRDGHACADCGAMEKLHTHHLDYARIGRDGELDDVVTLCARCHDIAHAPERAARAVARRSRRESRRGPTHPPTPCGVALEAMIRALFAPKPAPTKTPGPGPCVECGERSLRCPYMDGTVCATQDAVKWVREWAA